MRLIDNLTVSVTANTEQVIRVIDECGSQIALLIDESGELKGVVTDGDIRRAIIKGATLKDKIQPYIDSDFISVDHETSQASVLVMMKKYNIHQIPVLRNGKPIGVHVLDDLITESRPDVEVVIMAGGLGTRLRPLTEECPKPMLKLGGQPILEIIINSLVKEGITKIHLSVNYLKGVIVDYFGDGSKFGVEIQYLIEENPLGTAGALTLMNRPDKPILVMNGDVLTKVDYGRLIDSHLKSEAQCSVCVRKHVVEVPFGVVQMEGDVISGITEKPTFEHFVNAGIYVLNPEIVIDLEAGKRIDMPELLLDVMDKKMKVHGFPVYEYWLDIGRHQQLAQADKDYTDPSFFKGQR
ncbi:MAG: CBS domain-containing protein [Gammaproteobacteria bacterium]|nr:CBS domain-containing protein [Gammaproteobacteria bacterium]